jgi:sugar lactone lactonase YvrE
MLYSISEVRVFAQGLDHPEGVAVARDGTVYAGGEAGQVYRISADDAKVETIANTGGFCLGVTLDREENIYICDCAKRAVLKVTQGGTVSVAANSAEGRPFINPNFGVFDSKGNLYFSDSGEWKKGNGVVYCLRPGGKVTVFPAGPFHFANGLALDSDERWLYVVESNLDRVVRVQINPDGTAGASDVYCDGMTTVPDGLALDTAGNLYITTYGSSAVYRVSPDHHMELLCQDVENELLSLVTNCAFAGPRFDQLLVANLGVRHISLLDLKVQGQALWNQRAD